MLALSYGGRSELVDAAQQIAEASVKGTFKPAHVTEERFRDFLYDPTIPDPDLLIRTSGELRISNFLLWQLAYSEIWITDVYWPDFRARDLFRAIVNYQKRDRRFGGVE